MFSFKIFVVLKADWPACRELGLSNRNLEKRAVHEPIQPGRGSPRINRPYDCIDAWHMTHSQPIGKRAMPCISSFEGAVDAVTFQLVLSGLIFTICLPSLLRFMCLPLFITPSATPFKVSMFLCFFFQAFYYFAMVEDLIFRLLWTLTVSVGQLEIFHSELLKLILSMCEVFR